MFLNKNSFKLLFRISSLNTKNIALLSTEHEHFLSHVPELRVGIENDVKAKIDFELLNKKLLIIYFSAGWCATCKGFTPVLKMEYYSKSLDPTWMYVPLGKSTRDFLKLYKLEGLPSVKLVDNDGNLIEEVKMLIEDLIIPLNDSISLTINSLCAITKITVDSNLKNDLVLINGQTINNPRFELVFNEIRKIIGTRKRNLNGELLNDYFKIESTTNFPVAAGLASSAAGFAAISFGLCSLFKIKNQKEIIRLARIGSGSACRSILGGFVHWKAGNNNEDDSECTCEQIKQISHWEELRVLVIIQSEESKKIGSTEAMQRSVLTSKLLKTRIEECVPKRIENLKEAILTKNFSKLAEITMAESNQLHAICLDTFPPIIVIFLVKF